MRKAGGAFDNFNNKCAKQLRHSTMSSKNVRSTYSIRTIYIKQMRKTAEAFDLFQQECATQVKHSNNSHKNAQSS